MPFSGEIPRRYPVQFPQPAAGQEFKIIPNQEGAWRIIQMLWTLTTSVAVATRQTGLKLTDGNATHWFGVTPSTLAAGGSQIYQATQQAIPAASVGGVVQLALPPDGLFLPRGWTLQSNTAALDVADQYSAIVLQIQELPDGKDFMVEPSIALTFVPSND